MVFLANMHLHFQNNYNFAKQMFSGYFERRKTIRNSAVQNDLISDYFAMIQSETGMSDVHFEKELKKKEEGKSQKETKTTPAPEIKGTLMLQPPPTVSRQLAASDCGNRQGCKGQDHRNGTIAAADFTQQLLRPSISETTKVTQALKDEKM